jgi:hypothetical protein
MTFTVYNKTSADIDSHSKSSVVCGVGLFGLLQADMRESVKQ